MSRKRLLILGGYGNTGRPLAELLLKHSDARLVLAGGLWLRLGVDWLAALVLTLLTLGRNRSWRSRLTICSALIGWHLRGCSASGGLPR
jgi:hypothetical protein